MQTMSEAQAPFNGAGTGVRAPRIAITGASGLIGRRLSAALSAEGWTVERLVRHAPAPSAAEIHWDPAVGKIEESRLRGADAVIHLAGENIAGRWTEERRRRIHDSRVHGTLLLAGALARLEPPPRVLISASAIGYYGDRNSEVLTEDSAGGTGFLADTCQAWEAATQAARDAGIRVVNLRIGVVLSREGGMLRKVLRPYRLGLGGPVGSGRQWISWIALSDLVALICYLITDTTISGPVNATAPNAVTNAEFSRTLAKVLHRPAFLRVPRWAVSLLFGEMGHATVLASTRVLPARLANTQFRFVYPELEPALRAVLATAE
jgi:hypothetical protein